MQLFKGYDHNGVKITEVIVKMRNPITVCKGFLGLLAQTGSVS